MSLLGFFKRKRLRAAEGKKVDRGFLVFENTSEVIQAESILKAGGMECPGDGAAARDQKRLRHGNRVSFDRRTENFENPSGSRGSTNKHSPS